MRAVIDERGRVFGRINLVDAAIGAFVVVLIPVAYGTVLLFRTAKPTITSVDRVQVTSTEERAGGGTRIDAKLKVHGSGLRPTLRAMIGEQDAVGFLFETPSSADVLIGAIAPGTHDLVLYDGVQEVARAKGAVTVTPAPMPSSARVLAVGAFVGLDEPTATRLSAGASSGSGPTVVAVGRVEPDYRHVIFSGGLIEVPLENRFQRQAAVAVPCEAGPAQECRVDGESIGLLERGLIVTTAQGPLRLLIQEVVPVTAPVSATVRVRFAGDPDVIDRVTVGNSDMPQLALDGRGAVIQSLARRADVVGYMTLGFNATTHTGDRSTDVGETSIQGRLAVIDAILRLGVDRTPSGWRYRGQALKAGGAITFTTDSLTVRGSLLSLMTVPEADERRTSR